MFKRIAGVLIGILAALVLIQGSQALSGRIYPMPEGLDPNDAKALGEWIRALPAGALLLVLAGYVAGSFAGGAVATLVSARDTMLPALVVGVLLTIAGIATLASFPHPVWFAIASLATYLPCAWVGWRAAARRKETAVSVN